MLLCAQAEQHWFTQVCSSGVRGGSNEKLWVDNISNPSDRGAEFLCSYPSTAKEIIPQPSKLNTYFSPVSNTSVINQNLKLTPTRRFTNCYFRLLKCKLKSLRAVF